MKQFVDSLTKKQAAILFLVAAFILYGNTLGHDYTLDDAIAITENNFTKKGISGVWDHLSNESFVGFYGTKKDLVSGGRYRPLSFVLFSIEYGIFGRSAFFSHLFSILWYALNGFVLFFTLQKLLPKKYSEGSWLALPLFASLLWFFHPIHTEVVANVKGRDEIMAFTGVLAALYVLLRYLKSKKGKDLLIMSVLFFLALLSKENAITWLAVFPLAIYFFKRDQLKAALPAFGSLILVAFVWLGIRYSIVGGTLKSVADNLMNDPFLDSTAAEKYATIVYTLGKYLQLLIYPHPLTFDYYPKNIPIVNWRNSMVLLSIFIYLILFVLAIWGFVKRNILGFGIAFFAINLSIVSNLFFPVGTFMNERFVYIASLGFSLILAYFLLYGIQQFSNNKQTTKAIFIGLSSIVLLLYSFKTISRNQVWKDNLTLATHDAQLSVNGAKSNVMAGGLLLEEAQKEQNEALKEELLQQSLYYLFQALTIYPEYADALLLMGNAQWEKTNNAGDALPYYQRILDINPMNDNVWQNIFYILDNTKGSNYKLQTYGDLLKYGTHTASIYLKIGRIFGQDIGNFPEAENQLKEGLKFDPNSYELLTNLGTVYGLQEKYVESIEVLEKALQINNREAKTYIELGLSYYHNGQLQKAKQSFDKATEINPDINRSNFPI